MDQELHRRTVRLPDFDYSQAGAYFVTICAFQHRKIFGTLAGEEIQLSDIGSIILEEWEKTPMIRPNIELGAYVIMPNHFHAIVHIVDNDDLTKEYIQENNYVNDPAVGAYSHTPLPDQSPHPMDGTFNPIHVPLPVINIIHKKLRSPSGTIGSVVRGFKASVTTRVNTQRNTSGLPIWQRGYYEHIIRTEHAYTQIEGYILENPLRWGDDPENCG